MPAQKVDLSACSFIIPVRIDSPERRENLFFTLAYLFNNFNTSVVVVEESGYPSLRWEFAGWDKSFLKYLHIPSASEFLHRTRALNVGATAARSGVEIVVLHDTDVLLKRSQCQEAQNLIKNNLADAVLPYNGMFLNISRDWIHHIHHQDMNLDCLEGKDFENLNTESVGGSIFVSRKRFEELGRENENFISWGFEDNERVERYKKLGKRVLRAAGPLYHVDHPRGLNSAGGSIFYDWNKKELDRIRNMSAQDLSSYIETWPWRTGRPSWWDNAEIEAIRSQSGGVDARTRIALRERVINKGYHSMIDLGCGYAEDPAGFTRAGYAVEYTGVDLCRKLVNGALSRGLYTFHCDIKRVPVKENYAECAVIRNVLEWIPSYQAEIREAIRLASREVIVILSILPIDGENDRVEQTNQNGVLFRNAYSRTGIESLVRNHSKVGKWWWDQLSDNETMLIMELKQ